MRDSNPTCRLGEISAAAFARIAPLNPVILLPLGSHEDHGPLLPMGDYLLGDVLAGRIAAAAAGRGVPSFVAPSLNFGVADYFGASPGGLAISPAAFHAVLSDLLAGLLRHGLTRIVLLNGHGGNAPVIHEVTSGIRRSSGVIIPSFYLWKIAKDLMVRQVGAGRNQFGHGAEPLLSLSLALRPGDVSLNPPPAGAAGSLLGLPVCGFGTLAFQGIEIDAPVDFIETPKAAIAGAFPAASPELGHAVAAALVALGADFIVHFAANSASASGVSKSATTEPVSTGTSATNSI